MALFSVAPLNVPVFCDARVDRLVNLRAEVSAAGATAATRRAAPSWDPLLVMLFFAPFCYLQRVARGTFWKSWS